MKISKKLGALLVGGVIAFSAAFPMISEAAPDENDNPPSYYDGYGCGYGYHHYRDNDCRGLQRLGINQATFDSYLNKGYSPRDIYHASFIAKASGQSLDKVLSYKTEDNTWRAVLKKVGVTEEQLRQTRDLEKVGYIAKRYNLNQGQMEKYIKDGYRLGDVMMGQRIAHLSGKSFDDVMAMKKVNNDWRDIADSLNLDWDRCHAEYDD